MPHWIAMLRRFSLAWIQKWDHQMLRFIMQDVTMGNARAFLCESRFVAVVSFSILNGAPTKIPRRQCLILSEIRSQYFLSPTWSRETLHTSLPFVYGTRKYFPHFLCILVHPVMFDAKFACTLPTKPCITDVPWRLDAFCCAYHRYAKRRRSKLRRC